MDSFNVDSVNVDLVNVDSVNVDSVNVDSVDADSVNADLVNADSVNVDSFWVYLKISCPILKEIFLKCHVLGTQVNVPMDQTHSVAQRILGRIGWAHSMGDW